ncbi:MAG: thiolase domain-containing protein [Atribacterota bacterium]|nr:thiolase domain-containing protein [Atribacterota bacterium]MDD5636648.1 thiolase domain-containing protein [Atribacterota bacterium]
MRDVAIIGVGITKFGELWEKSLRDIFVESALMAIDDCGVNKIDSMYIGNFSGGLFVGQEHLSSLLADYLGCTSVPTTRIESACASGALALKQAFLEVASGFSDIVLAGGVEKMTDVDTGEATFGLAAAADREYEAFHGVTFPGLYALIARRHMFEYGTTREQLAKVAVKNHKNGAKNPHAQFPFKVTLEQVLNSTLIADPLRLLDCSPISDGAASVIICPAERAKELTNKPVKIIGVGHATDTIALADRENITTLKATVEAGKQAYKMAEIGPEDIDLAEIHDCFTIAEICAIEDLGFVKKGEGGRAVEEGLTDIDGKIPVNPSGGLKSKGHPVGATGIAQIVEVVTQLRGEAAARQVKNAKIGLTHNLGGSGGSVIVHILEAM